MSLPIIVQVWQDGELVRSYVMDHDDTQQRRVLGEQCRNAFEGGQEIRTFPAKASAALARVQGGAK